jgi:hypothetical protein
LFILLLLGAAVQPASANCASAVGFFMTYGYVQTPGQYATYCPFPDPYPPYPVTVSWSFTGAFWALGYGNPAIGAGIDNGDFEARYCTYGGGCFGWVNNSFCYSPQLYGDWHYYGYGLDGCIADVPGEACMAVLLTDGGVSTEWDGHFALLTRKEDANGDFFFDEPPGSANIVLSPIPQPNIVASARTGPTTIEVTVPGPQPASLAAGLYLDGDCGDSPIDAYRIVSQSVPHGVTPPADRRLPSGWELSSPTMMGDSTSLSLVCAEDADIYLATSLIADLESAGGFETQHVSGNSAALCCGPDVPDLDSDAFCADTNDCDDSDGNIWFIPGEVRSLHLSHDQERGTTSLSWTSPAEPGGAPLTVAYDTLRSDSADDFIGSAICVESNDATDTIAEDTTGNPSAGAVFYYLIRAENGCGAGSIGDGRYGRDCP